MRFPWSRGAKRPRLSKPDDQMTLTEHLAELRTRIIRAMLAVVAGMIVILVFYDQVLEFITQPYYDLCQEKPSLGCNGTLYSLSPLDGFTTRLRVATYGGIIIALPVVMWQIWRFVVPALHAKEKRYAIPFILSSVVLFGFGCFLAYWTLDKALDFLISWSGDDVEQAYQVGKYVSLVGLMAAAFGIGFLLPVLVVFLQLVNVIQPRTLLRQWRYAIMIIFVLAAVITPSGDPISMLALALPMTFLYFLAILIGHLVLRRRAAAEAAAAA